MMQLQRQDTRCREGNWGTVTDQTEEKAKEEKKAFNALKGEALGGRRAPIIRNDRSTRITKPSAGPSALVQQINNKIP